MQTVLLIICSQVKADTELAVAEIENLNQVPIGPEFNLEAAAPKITNLLQQSSDHDPVFFRVRRPFAGQPETPRRPRHQDCGLRFCH